MKLALSVSIFVLYDCEWPLLMTEIFNGRSILCGSTKGGGGTLQQEAYHVILMEIGRWEERKLVNVDQSVLRVLFLFSRDLKKLKET